MWRMNGYQNRAKGGRALHIRSRVTCPQPGVSCINSKPCHAYSHSIEVGESIDTIDYVTGIGNTPTHTIHFQWSMRDTLLVAQPHLLFTGKLGVNWADLAL